MSSCPVAGKRVSVALPISVHGEKAADGVAQVVLTH